MSVDFSPLQTHASEWQPSSCRVALNCRLEGRIVPSHSPDGVRLDAAHVAVLDGFFGEPERLGLLASLTGSSSPGAQPGPPPEALWVRNTADGAHASKTWGLREAALERMAAQPSQAMLEVQTRLAKLYPECIVAHMPSAQMQATAGGSPEPEPAKAATAGAEQQEREELEAAAEQEQGGGQPAAAAAADCCNLLANAPVHGDRYSWHVDADPLTLPPCAWRAAFGDYCNREPGLPLLASLLLYLVGEEWEPDWHAETLFLDTAADVGIVVRPKRYRAVLMDQDVLHRVVAPSLLAGGRPRYSLVWKLAFLPRTPSQACCIARPEWGPPSSIGSAARLDAVRQAVAQERKRKREPAPAEETQQPA